MFPVISAPQVLHIVLAVCCSGVGFGAGSGVRGKVILPEFGRDFFPKRGRENFPEDGRQNFSYHGRQFFP